MASTRKNARLNLRMALEEISIPSRKGTGTQKHTLCLELIWPRTGIPRRTCLLTVPLVGGQCITEAWSVANKLCFKETCEDVFALKALVTPPISQTKRRQFITFMAAKTAKVLADTVEDAVPWPGIDEIAATPLAYLARQLQTEQEENGIAVGTVDLNAQDVTPEPRQITIPLTALRDRKANGVTVVRRNQADGKVILTVQPY